MFKLIYQASLFTTILLSERRGAIDHVGSSSIFCCTDSGVVELDPCFIDLPDQQIPNHSFVWTELGLTKNADILFNVSIITRQLDGNELSECQFASFGEPNDYNDDFCSDEDNFLYLE